MAIVADGARGRVYLSPTDFQEVTAFKEQPEWRPEVQISGSTQYLGIKPYGMDRFDQIFTSRQLIALNTFAGLVQEAIDKVLADSLSLGADDDGLGLEQGGRSSTAYAQAIGVYLGFVVSSLSDRLSTICSWDAGGATWGTKMRNTFSRQAIQMSWDFAEVNPFSGQSGSWDNSLDYSAKGVSITRKDAFGFVFQADASTQEISKDKVVSTDPPYYDNIPYADLSDYFYVWLRRALKPVFPNLYATMAVPKADELVAFAHRHDGKEGAEKFFLDGMTCAMHNLAEQAHPSFPVTIYYAFKQAETKADSGTSSTGWETFLGAVIRAGFALTGTWPMRTELGTRMRGSESNALASSIVLVCRKREADAVTISRRDFLRELNATLPEALAEMTRGGINSPVAPVDLSQAIIGPGMEVFSKYSAVIEANGKPMTVRTALQLINRFIGEDDFDHDTQFCLAWFEQHGWAEGKYGDADVLARAKGTSVGGLIEAGVVASAGGDLRLLKWAEMPRDWSPENDSRLAVWEGLHQLIRALNQDGESAAGALLARMPDKTASLNALMYRLYTLCERQGWAEEARAYNELQGAWAGIEQASQEIGHSNTQVQMDI